MKRLIVSALALSLSATPAAAQGNLLAACSDVQATASPSVPGGLPAEVNEQFQFLCGLAVNALTNVQPTVGIAFSGGAHTLGSSTTIGRRLGFVPRVSVTARVNGAFADVPDLLDGFDPTLDARGQVPAMGTAGVPVAAIQGDVVVGLFNGVNAGPAWGGLGAVDLLGSVSFVLGRDEIGLDDDIVTAAIGARVGILQQGLVAPGISVSGMYRTMLGDDPTFGDISAGDPAQFSSDLSVLSFRGGISKGIAMLDLNAGVGYDIYTSDVAFSWELVCPAEQCDQDVVLSITEPVTGELKTSAWNVHGSLGLNLMVLNLVGELGYQKALDVADASALADADLGQPGQDPTVEALDGGRFFGSIGVRLTF